MRPNKTYIIAEIGPNHNGSIKLATKYIKLLARSGANAVKFQLSEPEKALSKDSFPAKYEKNSKGFKKNLDIFETVKKRQLTKKNHEKLFKICKKYKIDYLCSAFDIESLKFLNEKLSIRYFKSNNSNYLCKNFLPRFFIHCFFMCLFRSRISSLVKVQRWKRCCYIHWYFICHKYLSWNYLYYFLVYNFFYF